MSIHYVTANKQITINGNFLNQSPAQIMTIENIFDLISSFAGPLALIIIATPKLTELVLGRYLTGSLEKVRQSLQVEVERAKLEFAKSLESHKMELQGLQAENQRKYTEELSISHNASQHKIEIISILLADIRETIERIKGRTQETYKIITEFLDRTLARDIKQIPSCMEYIKRLDTICERPLAMTDPYFNEEVRNCMVNFAATAESEITKIKRVLHAQ